MAKSARVSFLPSGSKCENELGGFADNVSGLKSDNESVANGLTMFNTRNVLDKGVVTMPRSSNGDNTQLNVFFDKQVVVQDPTGQIVTTVDQFGQYAVIYEVTYGGYFVDADGNPIDDKARVLREKATQSIAS